MLKQLGNLNPQQFMSGSQEGATMANNMSSRQACHAARYVVARVLRGLFWCLKYTVILPLYYNGPDDSVCFMEGQHHAGEITG